MNGSVAIIEIPEELLAKIDKAVGSGERVAFLTEAAESALRRRNFQELLDDMEKNGPVWKDEDHPELAEGTYAYVRKLRDEGESRMKAVEDAWSRD